MVSDEFVSTPDISVNLDTSLSEIKEKADKIKRKLFVTPKHKSQTTNNHMIKHIVKLGIDIGSVYCCLIVIM